MKCNCLTVICAAALVGGEVPLGAAEPQPLVVKATSPWNLNYADDSCRMARVFTHESGKMLFLIDQFGMASSLNVTVAGKPLRYNTAKIHAAFGPAGGKRSFDNPFDVSFGSYGPAILINGIDVIEPPADEATRSAAGEDTANSANPARAPSSEAERAIRWFEVQVGKRAPIRFDLGPMDKPMAALRTCTEELVSHWGIDVAAHRTLTRQVTPRTKPDTWVSSEDYPHDLVARGTEGIVQFRLSIAEDGGVTGCNIQQSTRPAEFDAAVCRIMTKRARFDPALDANGKPIKSYWRSSFRFVMP